MSRVLVFDCGTSALKAVVFEADGTIASSAEAPYPPSSNPHRQDPNHWWAAAREVSARLDRAEISAVALTGAMENLILIDAAGEPVADAIVYADPCGARPLDQLAPALAEAGQAAIVGNAPEPLMTAFKIAWLRAELPEVLTRARWLLPGFKDFLALKLTGVAATDPTCATTTGLMDLARRDWSAPLLEFFAIGRSTLPPIRPATDILGPLLPQAATDLSLAAGIPVVNGCGDAGATTVGSGADSVHDISVYLGTSGWVARVGPSEASARSVPYYRLAHPVESGLIEIAPILSGGAAAAWARSALHLDLQDADRLASQSDESPKEILFFPYLSGERSPFLDLELRAAFTGIGADATAGDLYRAVLEGVAFAIAANLQAMGHTGGKSIGLVGGGALSAVWPQLIADATGMAVTLPGHPVEATASGAFRIAQRALGIPHATSGTGVTLEPRFGRWSRTVRLSREFSSFTRVLRERGHRMGGDRP